MPYGIEPANEQIFQNICAAFQEMTYRYKLLLLTPDTTTHFEYYRILLTTHQIVFNFSVIKTSTRLYDPHMYASKGRTKVAYKQLTIELTHSTPLEKKQSTSYFSHIQSISMQKHWTCAQIALLQLGCRFHFAPLLQYRATRHVSQLDVVVSSRLIFLILVRRQ